MKKKSSKSINLTFLLAAIMTSFAFIVHSYSFLYRSKMIVGVWVIPLWVNAIAIIFTGYLAFYFWRNFRE